MKKTIEDARDNIVNAADNALEASRSLIEVLAATETGRDFAANLNLTAEERAAIANALAEEEGATFLIAPLRASTTRVALTKEAPDA